MEASLGWVLLSRERLAQAARAMEGDQQGVLDELGLLEVHRGYAQRFFPGTSVLHTRLRYALFVGWLYADLEDERPSDVRAAMRNAEFVLTGQLMQGSGSGSGVIGGSLYGDGRSPQTLACDAYWSALQAWGLAPRVRGELLARRTVHARLRRKGVETQGRDDDGKRLCEQERLFHGLPGRPEGWGDKDTPLDFVLSAEERAFLRKRLLTTLRPEGGPSLLSRLVAKRVPMPKELELYDTQIVAAAGEEAHQLEQAQGVAYLGGVLRGVYAALVEERAELDGHSPGDRHRTHLAEIVDRDRDLVLACDVEHTPARPRLRAFLREGQEWLERGDVSGLARSGLARSVERRERALKGTARVRLGESAVAHRRRQEWDPERFPKAGPLHYRWPWVRGLLGDLNGTQAPEASE